MDARPVWHGRDKADLRWDIARPLPESVPPCNGMIVLAGRHNGTQAELDQNSAIATAALNLAQKHDIGPVLLCSSSAVYGHTEGPQSEDVSAPASPYGAAKLAMEQTAAKHAMPSTCLRIGNVVGADMALVNAAKGPVVLDQFEDGQTPRRMYIGPASLLRVMLDLIDMANKGQDLPPILNVARPGVIAMGDLLDVARAEWTTRPAPTTALPELALDLSRLLALLRLEPATPTRLVLEARLAGWECAR